MTTSSYANPGARRAFLALALLALAGGTARAAEFREITWDDLMPAGWDPMSSLTGMGDYPDNDPRSQKLVERMRALWDAAPTVPALAGKSVRLAGYLVPLDEARDGLRAFLLVPYLGACIHTPPPPANQIVHVLSQSPVKGFRTMDAVWVSGTIELDRANTDMGVSGYTMTASRVTAYKGNGRNRP
jgi:uncharacterized protein